MNTVDDRTRRLLGLRDLIDWLITNSAAPVPSNLLHDQMHFVGNDPDVTDLSDEVAELGRIAAAMGTEITDMWGNPVTDKDRSLHAIKEFNGMRYEALVLLIGSNRDSESVVAS